MTTSLKNKFDFRDLSNFIGLLLKYCILFSSVEHLVAVDSIRAGLGGNIRAVGEDNHQTAGFVAIDLDSDRTLGVVGATVLD